ALVIIVMNRTIVSTAIPKIGSDFHALEKGSWIVTAYILSFDALQPMYGKLSDIFGRKYVLMPAVFIFLLGSVLCGVSTNMVMIIVMRAIQGVGGAGIFSCVFITVADMIPLRSRGQYSALISTVFAVASVLGPLIAFTDHVSWKWAFFINLPVGGLGTILLIFFMKEKRKHAPIRSLLKRVDYLGTAAILAFSTLILVALNLGGVQYAWNSAPVVVCLILGIFFLGVLILVEWKYAKEPIMPVHLFKNRTVVCVCSMNLFFNCGIAPVIIELPLFLQAARGDSATMSGVRIIVGQAAICTVSGFTGYLMGRLNSYKYFLIVGNGLTTLGIALFSLFTDTSPFGYLYGFIIIAGTGSGMIYACSTVAAQSACDPKDLAVVTGLVNFFMNLGVAVGIAVASAVINNGLENCLIQTFEPDTVTSIMQSSTFIRSGALSPEQIDITAKCYNSSFRSMWFAATAFAGIGFISTLFIKQHSLLGQQPKEIDVNEEKMVQDTENQKIENEEIEYQIDEGDDTTIQKKE
ncbi:major facilitator superfamily domain-containing protein, partial [Umbelopsis sp. PMI_123]